MTSSSSDKMSPVNQAPQLTGRLNIDGTAELQEDQNSARQKKGDPPRSLKAALDAVAESRADASSETASEEDYDALKHDPMAVKHGGKGGGFGANQSEEITEKIANALNPTASVTSRRKSIPVTLNKLKEEGRYVLTADDAALREILREGIEREKNPGAVKRRSKFSDLVFTRRFTTFDRNNPTSTESPFHGFFTFFWLAIAIYMIRLAAENWRQYGHILGTNEIMGLMFHRDVLVLAISDGVMCGSTVLTLLLQKLILKGLIKWNREGWIIQSLWQALFLSLCVYWTLFREWPWTHTVFFVLHALVMLMKQHAFAFYNGHLSEELKNRETLQQKLRQLEGVAPAEPSSAISTSCLDQPPSESNLNQRHQDRRPSSQEVGASNIARISDALSSGEELDSDQIRAFERIVKWEIDALSTDLMGKTSDIQKSYPNNLSFKNFFEFLLLPTLVYELEYPRSDKIDWFYVAEKTIAVVGILGVMNLVSQTFIYPVVMRTIAMKEVGMSLQQRLELFPWMLGDLTMPFMAEYMLTWYVIWECILNLLAELTYFADRSFYGDWWNSISWDQFARDWNRPVHNFLLRHVYHSSISSMKVNKNTATLITFFLSALVHELIMWCLFKKLRGYLLFMQMMQIPLVKLSRSKWLRGKATLGNLIFWIGIFSGPSLLCSLYLVI